MLSSLEEDLWRLADTAANDIEGRTGRKQMVQDAVDQLPTEQKRLVIRMRYFQGYAFREIADHLGKTINAIYKSHFDALEDLEKILRKDFDLDG
jgi:RNA polymerase sigma factor (sigma-70 family)